MSGAAAKMCNVASYLFEQEVACRRMERVTHPETRDGQEWGRIAQVLFELRVKHLEQCRKCEPCAT